MRVARAPQALRREGGPLVMDAHQAPGFTDLYRIEEGGAQVFYEWRWVDYAGEEGGDLFVTMGNLIGWNGDRQSYWPSGITLWKMSRTGELSLLFSQPIHADGDVRATQGFNTIEGYQPVFDLLGPDRDAWIGCQLAGISPSAVRWRSWFLEGETLSSPGLFDSGFEAGYLLHASMAGLRRDRALLFLHGRTQEHGPGYCTIEAINPASGAMVNRVVLDLSNYSDAPVVYAQMFNGCRLTEDLGVAQLLVQTGGGYAEDNIWYIYFDDEGNVVSNHQIVDRQGANLFYNDVQFISFAEGYAIGSTFSSGEGDPGIALEQQQWWATVSGARRREPFTLDGVGLAYVNGAGDDVYAIQRGGISAELLGDNVALTVSSPLYDLATQAVVDFDATATITYPDVAGYSPQLASNIDRTTLAAQLSHFQFGDGSVRNLLTAQEETFEQSSSLGRWEHFTGWPMTVSTDVAHTGTHSMKATNPIAEQDNTDVEVRNVRGNPTSCDLWVYNATSIRAHGFVEVRYYDATFDETGFEYLPLVEWAQSAWTNYSGALSTPGNTTGFIFYIHTGRVISSQSWAAGDSLYYDDIVIAGTTGDGNDYIAAFGGGSRGTAQHVKRDRRVARIEERQA